VRVMASGSRMLVATLVLSGCVGPAGNPEDGPGGESAFTRVVQGTVDTVVSTESGLLAMASDLALTGDGTLLVLDRNSHALHVIAPDGSHLRTVGRMGAGPGEFSRTCEPDGEGVSVPVDVDRPTTYLGI
jgi:hypothetical protein